MRFKPVPAPPDGADALADAQRAVPLVPGTETDCCARLVDRLRLDSRDEARRWLTFLRALGLAEETAGGFVRTDRDPTSDAVREAFRERVFLADELLAVLDRGALDADAAFESVVDDVPEWERHREEWDDTWRERVHRLLDWAVVLGLAERRASEYVVTSAAGKS